ncbi:hypothetical protein KIH39_08625 [Telmatocola sphagniphila]|uniref:Uncharacterized protein n=1 Tax=Telmatocola sphagniphila TaxID=1123043 RepID=A0A8E6EZY3_9BACT|nr:hypothetical protein [Telmatocola sphagniphila]QVL33956.1 hypothetical protein KIH39_08625 [Telmatocola sphagniphila]
MNSFSKVFGIAAFFVIVTILRDPNPFKKWIREAVAPETPTAEQLEWKHNRERINHSLEYNPQQFRDLSNTRAEVQEFLKKGGF